jgi:hypothetical protein
MPAVYFLRGSVTHGPWRMLGVAGTSVEAIVYIAGGS